jgi:hypothetical protein
MFRKINLLMSLLILFSFLVERNGQTITTNRQQNKSSSDYQSMNFSSPIEAEMEVYNKYLMDLYKDVKLWRDIYITFGNVFSIIGVALNTLCIIIFYKSKLFRNSSFPYYVNILAIVDTLNIFFR